ncbi:hypothetical protein FNH05_23885 [Amycolatopsis rhizosphaerae]|uniref:Uncharacterized protein n=1 Tax=Amycolatopsis rhizosphaerae TaxID=2053003 RepID=A0A558BT25_9PSEU|nr:hypothetical protein [Amycolatopsis rhizosphaerae]TVT39698.1 hypothetical protein FNH05_23885 [Amycolatopsis rhizosphaerae]
MATTTSHRTARSLVPDAVFDQLVERIVHDEDMARPLAERIVDQALAFLAACATDHDRPLAPSFLVDIGWHTFLLHTRAYAQFCQQVAGRFLHHAPTEPGTVDREEARETRDRTLAAIEAAGYAVDPDLWPQMHAECKQDDCHQCHQGCTDSPKKK